ncbi:hypothetical protein BDW59DRAFT_157153 [Aspergillus cavernicola]|uniref:SGNH hydrolase-type esterase domain-containing protein n=1 Tax=Aspergillus cavernicola TaxID=176166 RepID=A0ABR4IZ44_9EURO
MASEPIASSPFVQHRQSYESMTMAKGPRRIISTWNGQVREGKRNRNQPPNGLWPMARSWVLFLSVLLGAWFALAAPGDHNHHGYAHSKFHDVSKRAEYEKVPLRILSLGASLTWGLLSTSGNGYRKPLRDQLRFDGWEVDMVGRLTNGDMYDNEVEAHSGDTITKIQAASKLSLDYRPNVVLINAGINDARLEIDIINIGRRMQNMIEDILSTAGMDKTIIILSTLIPSENFNIVIHREEINMQYRSLVQTMQADGVRIVLADMDPEYPDAGNGWLSFPDDFYHADKTPPGTDDTHPNEQGYAKMAYVFYKGIMAARDKGFLQMPNEMDSVAGPCQKVKGDGVSSVGLTQHGSGKTDGIYYHSSEAMGTILSVTSDYDHNQWFFARLFRQDRDDLLGWFNHSDGSVAYGTWRNTGNQNQMFVRIADTSVADNCVPRGVVFIDLNADGLDDFACIGSDGTVYASINQGDGTDSTPPTFEYIGKVRESLGAQNRVRLADIDGDGRADYCVIADDGDISCWRNGGLKDVPEYWQPMGKRFTGNGFHDIRGVRFEDINGDGRDDWMWVNDDGETHTYTNSRSCHRGEVGDGLKVIWRHAFHKGVSHGPTHHGMSGFLSDDIFDVERNYLRDRVHLARVYGEPQDFGLLGRQDYVFMEHIKNEDRGKHQFNMHVWKNTGSGGTKIKVDGNQYCNMMGHTDGRMDYVWILSKGAMRMYENKGATILGGSESFWGPNYVIWDPVYQSIAREVDRRDLHLVDWNGDGKCDIVWTDPENQNRPQVWLNHFDAATKEFNWEYNANPAPDLYCPEKRGLGLFDLPVQFADLSGSGRGDYLCIERDGRTWGWVHNEAGTWVYADQFKSTEGKDRANLHWADVDADGRADLIFTDKFNGDGTVWLNKGRQDVANSRYHWELLGEVFAGAAAGACTYYPDLDGNGRADMHILTDSLANKARTWFSHCGRVDRVGDDGVPPDVDEDDGEYDQEDTDGLDFDYARCTKSYEVLEDIPDDVESACVSLYVLETMRTMLKNDLQNYTDILDDGYDGKFQMYAEVVADQSPGFVHDFLMTNGSQYFNCKAHELVLFCPTCADRMQEIAPYTRCRYCTADQDGQAYINVTEPCPPDMSEAGALTKEQMTYWWTFKNQGVEAEFYEGLFTDTGIMEDQIVISDYMKRPYTQWCVEHGTCWQSGWDFDVPVLDPYFGVDDVANPKNTIAGYLSKLSDLQHGLDNAINDIRIGVRRSWSGEDMVDALSSAVLSIHQALESMAEVVDAAEEIEEERKKEMILLFLSAFLILIPIGGEILSAISGMAAIGRIVAMAGEGALVGLDIYTVVEDPSSAPFIIFGYILHVGALRDATKIRNAAVARRGMKQEDVDKMGAVFSRGMVKIDTVMKACKL